MTSLTFSTPFPIPTINRQCDIVDTCATSQSLGKCSIFQNLNDLAVESPVSFLWNLSHPVSKSAYICFLKLNSVIFVYRYLWTGGLALDELQVKFTHMVPKVLFVVAFVLKITAGLSKKRIEDLVSKWILHELNCSSWKLSTSLVRVIIRSK